MIQWKKTGKVENEEGSTITYSAEGSDVTIESRKRHIPHAGCNSGTWDHTTYWVLKAGKEVAQEYRMSEAKFLAESMIEEGKA